MRDVVSEDTIWQAKLFLRKCDPTVVTSLYSNDTGYYAPCRLGSQFVAVVEPASQSVGHFERLRHPMPAPVVHA
jgi:hypothetical protein